jgi:chemotaxis protein MotB
MGNHPDTLPELPPLDPALGSEPAADEPAHANAAEEQPHDEEHEGEHKHAAHHAHKGGHGGGGHGGSWIVTYCDMITLLIAFFICILTFASKESGKEKHPKLRDSILYGPGGTGVAGAGHKGSEQDSIVWRQVLVSAHQGPPGSRIPPLYSDPSTDRTTEVLNLLDQSTLGNLSDSFRLRLPLGLFFDDKKNLQPTGRQLLGSLAANLRRLPFDIRIQVDERQYLDRVIAMAQYLTNQQGIEADRIGAGVCLEPAQWKASIWFTFVSRK